MKQILKNIRLALTELADEKTRESNMRFFKETEHQKVRLYGLKSAEARKVSREQFAAVKGMSKEEVFALCEYLWQSNYLEETGIACDWTYRFHKEFKPGDFAVFESWIERYVTNWASCDVFCNHTMGTFLEMYPKHIAKLKKWAKSPNLWMRRAASVSLIHPARKKLFHKEIFDIATILLHDSEDLVQKGYGWMLKAASESDQEAVFQFVMANKATMPRTALRYAIEKMPQHLKKEAMAKEIAASSPSRKKNNR
jgi:3-methyladenine DNA glycosylase AlkD